MPSQLLANYGLGQGDALRAIHCHAGGYLLWNFLFAYAVTSTRPLKYYLRLDHNVCPREDVSKYGERAVKEGKISEQKLNLLKRNEGCHANNVEGYTLFVAAVLFGLYARLDPVVINRACAVYSLARVGYTAAYLGIDSRLPSYLRSVLWWTGNITCLTLFWKGGNNL